MKNVGCYESSGSGTIAENNQRPYKGSSTGKKSIRTVKMAQNCSDYRLNTQEKAGKCKEINRRDVIVRENEEKGGGD